MERIESNSYPSQVDRQSQSRNSSSKIAEGKKPVAEETGKVSAYSDIFDDKELERLQNNLQSVSELASKALERFKK